MKPRASSRPSGRQGNKTETVGPSKRKRPKDSPQPSNVDFFSSIADILNGDDDEADEDYIPPGDLDEEDVDEESFIDENEFEEIVLDEDDGDLEPDNPQTQSCFSQELRLHPFADSETHPTIRGHRRSDPSSQQPGFFEVDVLTSDEEDEDYQPPSGAGIEGDEDEDDIDYEDEEFEHVNFSDQEDDHVGLSDREYYKQNHSKRRQARNDVHGNQWHINLEHGSVHHQVEPVKAVTRKRTAAIPLDDKHSTAKRKERFYRSNHQQTNRHSHSHDNATEQHACLFDADREYREFLTYLNQDDDEHLPNWFEDQDDYVPVDAELSTLDDLQFAEPVPVEEVEALLEDGLIAQPVIEEAEQPDVEESEAETQGSSEGTIEPDVNVHEHEMQARAAPRFQVVTGNRNAWSLSLVANPLSALALALSQGQGSAQPGSSTPSFYSNMVSHPLYQALAPQQHLAQALHPQHAAQILLQLLASSSTPPSAPPDLPQSRTTVPTSVLENPAMQAMPGLATHAFSRGFRSQEQPNKVIFSPQQLKLLHSQLFQHTQLLIQNVLVYTQEKCFDVNMASASMIMLKDLRFRRSEVIRKYVELGAFANPLIEWNHFALYNVIAIDLLDPFMSELSGVLDASNPKPLSGTECKELVTPFSPVFHKSLVPHFFRPQLKQGIDMDDVDLVVARKSVYVSDLTGWMHAEDGLLELAVKEWGAACLKSKRYARYLPLKSDATVASRFLYWTHPQVPSNPIKAALEYRTGPLTKTEWKTIDDAKEIYGDDWKMIVKVAAPGRDPESLRRIDKKRALKARLKRRSRAKLKAIRLEGHSNPQSAS